jgi:hypothetical protein
MEASHPALPAMPRPGDFLTEEQQGQTVLTITSHSCETRLNAVRLLSTPYPIKNNSLGGTMRFLLQKQPLTAVIISLGLGASATQAQTAYNDAWWASPNANTSFVDQFDGVSINRTKWLVEKNIFVNGEDIDYQDVEYPAADWTFRVGQPDAGASDGKVLNLKARYMDGQIQDYYGGTAGQGKPLFIRAGRIESQIADDSTFVFGKFEARIKMPPARNGEFRM